MALISHSAGAILSICAGIATYTFVKFKRYRWGIIILAILIPITYASYTGKFQKSVIVAGRGPVWIKTAQLSLQHPFGYGVGTYKILFPHLCGEAITKQQPGREWNNSHNDWLQILFEAGFPGVILFLGWLITIVRKVSNPIKLAGLAIIATNMMIHFPNRQVQCALIMLMFLAFCSRGEKVESV
jgi:O-antigen ligase